MRFLLLAQEQGWLEWIHYYASQGTADWMPRAHCVQENPLVMFLHIFAELLIGVSYFSIPVILLHLAKKKAKFFREYKPIIILFAAFIFLCGTTHLVGILMFWYPVYWIDGGIKLVTGVVSLFTAITLFRLAPTILRLPSESELMDAHERAEKAEKRCKHLEDKMESWTEHVGQHIESLKREHTNVRKELVKKELLKKDVRK